jgi:hypothetical protein
MLIQSMKTHFAARTLEWFGAGIMGSWGYYVITHPQLFTSPATRDLFSGLVRVSDYFGQPPVTIGIMALLTGILRGGALFVNGAYQRTPLVRLITAFASAYIWTSVVIGFALTDFANTGMVLYPWLILMDVVSGYRAGYDLVIAESTARRARAINGQHDGSGSRRAVFTRIA